MTHYVYTSKKPHGYIEGVGGVVNGNVFYQTVDEVLDNLDRGERYYVSTRIGEPLVEIHPMQNGPLTEVHQKQLGRIHPERSIRSDADITSHNNLDNLPECP